jgi:hypothetical protein
LMKLIVHFVIHGLIIIFELGLVIVRLFILHELISLVILVNADDFWCLGRSL